MGLTREIDLHIDTLVIDGLSDADGVHAGQALSRELGRLLEGLPAPSGLAHDRTIDRLDAGTLPSGADARPSTLGNAVAQAVHRRLLA